MMMWDEIIRRVEATLVLITDKKIENLQKNKMIRVNVNGKNVRYMNITGGESGMFLTTVLVNNELTQFHYKHRDTAFNEIIKDINMVLDNGD